MLVETVAILLLWCRCSVGPVYTIVLQFEMSCSPNLSKTVYLAVLLVEVAIAALPEALVGIDRGDPDGDHTIGVSNDDSFPQRSEPNLGHLLEYIH
jgi:hypothetical protein